MAVLCHTTHTADPPMSAHRHHPRWGPRQYRVTAGQRCPSYRRAFSDTTGESRRLELPGPVSFRRNLHRSARSPFRAQIHPYCASYTDRAEYRPICRALMSRHPIRDTGCGLTNFVSQSITQSPGSEHPEPQSCRRPRAAVGCREHSYDSARHTTSRSHDPVRTRRLLRVDQAVNHTDGHRRRDHAPAPTAAAGSRPRAVAAGIRPRASGRRPCPPTSRRCETRRHQRLC